MKLREYRAKIGLSQTELSKKIGIPANTLFNYELNKCEPSIATLIKLADFFNISIDELVGRETDVINLKFLEESQSYLIKKIIKMNELQLMRARAYITGLME